MVGNGLGTTKDLAEASITITSPDQPALRLWDGYTNTRPAMSSLVMRLQQILRTQGYDAKPDGKFGRGTDEAVKAFQRSHGITEDGIVGPSTWKLLVGGESVNLGYRYQTSYENDNAGLKRDDVEASLYVDAVKTVAGETGKPGSLIVGIGSRESRWGKALTPPGPAGKGDYGHGRGLLQIDDRWHEFARSGNWQDPLENLRYGINLLNQFTTYIRSNNQHLSTAAIERAGIAAYNCGTGHVMDAIRMGVDIDYYTTGRNYSKDVLSRAGWFERKGWNA